MLIIDESNWRDHAGENGVVIDGGGQRRVMACKPRRAPVGSLKYAVKPEFDLIPRNEYSSRIKDIKAAGADTRTLLKEKRIPAFDQQQTSTCHAQSCALGVMASRARQGEATVILSPGSISGPITGYRDEGAYIEDDLRQVADFGVATIDFVPPNQISRRGWKPGAEENAKLHRLTQWIDMGSKDSQMFDRCATQLLLGNPVCVAYDWWEHAVTLIDLVEISPGVFGFEFRNSWGATYGDDGYGVLAEGRGTPNAAYSPVQATASTY
ncbi:MAG: hypothetical protein V4719_00880 [Planctomycetota bacterium]